MSGDVVSAKLEFWLPFLGSAMRLTLRTLLAYRDGVLSPSETSNLHQRIKQTELASNLLRRIDILVKHKQLLAPKVKGEGLGGDANSVAEYLDDTLASEQVPEFERICIAESDLVLAELAHCHQLLAEALNSQVTVPPSLKALAVSMTNPQSRMDLSRRLKIGGKKSSTGSAPGNAEVIVPGPAGSIRRVDESHSENMVVATAVEVDQNVAQSSLVQAPMVTSGGGSIKPQGLDLERPQLAHEVPEYLIGQRSGSSWQVLLAIGAMVALLAVIAWQALGPLSNVRDLFVVNNASSNDADPNATAAKELTSKAEPSVPKVSSGSASENEAANAVEHSNETSNPTKASVEVESDKAMSVAPSSRETEIAKADSTQPNAPNIESASPELDSIGNSIRWTPGAEDKKSVLLVRNKSGEVVSLSRLEANAPLSFDSEIVIPPSMRPALDLAGLCSWTVCGPTLMHISKDENVTVKTSLCRALTKASQQGSKLTIASTSVSVELQFEDAASMAAVEVAFRPVAHGPITDKLAFKPVLIVVAVGKVTVSPIGQGAESKSFRLVDGDGVAFIEGQPIEFEMVAIPAWYGTGNERPLDLLAAADLHKFINGDDVGAQLTAMVADRRPETAALAIETKMLLGDWRDFAGEFLNNESMRNHWTSALGLAEQLLAADQKNAVALRSAFEAAHPGEGESLFEMLVGSSESAQPKELLPKLVESLGSDQLNVRVLAAHQLFRLTGKDLGFQPSAPNRAVLQQWRRAISSSSSLLTLGDPIWEAKRTVPEK